MEDAFKKAEDIINNSKDPYAMLERAYHHPKSVEAIQKLLFEKFLPRNPAVAQKVNITNAAEAVLDYMLASHITNHMAKSMKESDAIERFTQAVPFDATTPISQKELESMQERVLGDLDELTRQGHQHTASVKEAVQKGFIDMSGQDIKELALFNRVAEAASEMYFETLVSVILEMGAEEQRPQSNVDKYAKSRVTGGPTIN